MELCGHHPTFLSLLVCLRVLFLDLLLLSDYFFRGEKIKTSRVFFFFFLNEVGSSLLLPRAIMLLLYSVHKQSFPSPLSCTVLKNFWDPSIK